MIKVHCTSSQPTHRFFSQLKSGSGLGVVQSTVPAHSARVVGVVQATVLAHSACVVGVVQSTVPAHSARVVSVMSKMFTCI